jgi:hypothetical protein
MGRCQHLAQDQAAIARLDHQRGPRGAFVRCSRPSELVAQPSQARPAEHHRVAAVLADSERRLLLGVKFNFLRLQFVD